MLDPRGATALAERPLTADEEFPGDVDDEFTLDVRVVVALAPAPWTDCPTDDGCGNTCSGNDSSCNSAPDTPF